MPHQPIDTFWPYEVIEGPSDLAIHHRGPPLEEGPLPTLFYFALSGKESLTLDPFNQPVVFLGKEKLRVFSFTLPAHGPSFENQQSMQIWSKKLDENENFVLSFVDSSIQNINFLVEKGYIDESYLAAAGLSRGGFMAVHLAAKDERIKTILGFAPITQVDFLNDFKDLAKNPLAVKLSLKNILNELADKHLRFYIGNRDLRVGTSCCFDFINELTEVAFQHGHRSPPIELIISPSIGYKGHGTPVSVFQDGAEWLLLNLNLKSNFS